jgi:hypothetical protein
VRSHTIIVTDADMNRFDRLIRSQRHSLFRDQQQLDLLDQVLQNADVRPPNRTPKTVVRMNSSVVVRDSDTRERERFTLVFLSKQTFREDSFRFSRRLGLRSSDTGKENSSRRGSLEGSGDCEWRRFGRDRRRRPNNSLENKGSSLS